MPTVRWLGFRNRSGRILVRWTRSTWSTRCKSTCLRCRSRRNRTRLFRFMMWNLLWSLSLGSWSASSKFLSGWQLKPCGRKISFQARFSPKTNLKVLFAHWVCRVSQLNFRAPLTKSHRIFSSTFPSIRIDTHKCNLACDEPTKLFLPLLKRSWTARSPLQVPCRTLLGFLH